MKSEDKLKYSHSSNKENVFRYSYNYNDGQRNQKFFVKPYIEISTELTKRSVNVQIADLNIFNPANFIVNVWTLRISNQDKRLESRLSFLKKIPCVDKIPYNKWFFFQLSKIRLSKNITECNVHFNIIEDGNPKYDNDMPLLWRRNELPVQCNAGSIRNATREQYVEAMPNSYGSELNKNSQSISMHIGTNNEILLFFTFEESNHIYLITHNELEEEENTISTTLPFDKDFEIQIRVSSNEYNDREGKSFRIIAESWDKINIKSIR